jgi:hypothetical protein
MKKSSLQESGVTAHGGRLGWRDADPSLGRRRERLIEQLALEFAHLATPLPFKGALHNDPTFNPVLLPQCFDAHATRRRTRAPQRRRRILSSG